MKRINRINNKVIAIVGSIGLIVFLGTNYQPLWFIVGMFSYVILTRLFIIRFFYSERIFCEKCGDILVKGETSNFFIPYKKSPNCGFKLKLEEPTSLIP